MCLQKTRNSTPRQSIAMVAYKNKRFQQRRESSKPWIRKAINTKPQGMRFNNSYWKIYRRTNHVAKDCRCKSKFKNYQPWSGVQTHLVNEEMNDDKDKAYGSYHNQNNEKYDNVL